MQVIGDKREEDLAAIFTDTLGFANAFLFVRIIFQMIKRTKQKHDVKGLVPIA